MGLKSVTLLISDERVSAALKSDQNGIEIPISWLSAFRLVTVKIRPKWD